MNATIVTNFVVFQFVLQSFNYITHNYYEIGMSLLLLMFIILKLNIVALHSLNYILLFLSIFLIFCYD